MLCKRNTYSAITADSSNHEIAALHVEAAAEADSKAATTFLRTLKLPNVRRESEHQGG
jgi:hypothetical protein